MFIEESNASRQETHTSRCGRASALDEPEVGHPTGPLTQRFARAHIDKRVRFKLVVGRLLVGLFVECVQAVPVVVVGAVVGQGLPGLLPPLLAARRDAAWSL
jgi:hypothetical protein